MTPSDSTDRAMAADDPFRFSDQFGPAKIVHITERTTALRATVIVDSVALGPAIGGVRMAPDVTTAECFGLARAMTWKNAAAGLRHGGGKAVIAADPLMPDHEKEPLLRAFAHAIADLDDYIPGPDMGTDETCMAWVHDEIGRSVGLPAALGGIPLDEIGATGYGLAASIDVAAEHIGMSLAGARVAVQGFGAVGRHVAVPHRARLHPGGGCRLGRSDRRPRRARRRCGGRHQLVRHRGLPSGR